MSRAFAVTVFGCTGNAGHAVAEMLAKSALSKGTPIAFAGRNKAKVTRVKNEILEKVFGANHGKDIGVIVADVSDADSLAALTQKTDILINCCGPFSQYGEPVVKACVEQGCHYADITGEIKWVRDMKDKYQEQALATNSTILSLCGYDSIPCELSAYLVCRDIAPIFKDSPATRYEIESIVSSRGGGIPRGTLLTALNEAGGKKKKKTKGAKKRKAPFVPTDEKNFFAKSMSIFSLLNPYSSLGTHPHSAFTAPHFMCTVNTPVVHASMASMGYGGFHYRDRMSTGKSAWWNGYGLISSLITYAVYISIGVAAFIPGIIGLVKKYASGRSFNGNENGIVSLRCKGIAETEKSRKAASVRMLIAGDAGIYATGLLASETALCMHQNLKSMSPGFQTPVQCLQEKLHKHLSSCDGVSIEVSSVDTNKTD